MSPKPTNPIILGVFFIKITPLSHKCAKARTFHYNLEITKLQ